MLAEKIKEVFDFLVFNARDAGQPNFRGDNYQNIPFNPNYFHSIPDADCSFKAAFIDGGQTNIFSGPNFSIDLLRVYFSIFNSKKRVKMGSFQCICVARSNDAGKYESKIISQSKDYNFSEKFEKISFDPMHHSAMADSMPCTPARICNRIRKFLEWSIAGEIIEKHLSKNDFVVMDGTLETRFENEQDFSDPVFDAALKKGVGLCAIAKTSHILTTSGMPLLYILNKLSKKNNEWYYNPIAEVNDAGHRAEIYAVKLHPDSKYIFRFEIFDKQNSESQKIISFLKENAKDSVAYGYPYGLIDANRNARVSSSEALIYLPYFQNNEMLSELLLSTNFHDYIDKT